MPGLAAPHAEGTRRHPNAPTERRWRPSPRPRRRRACLLRTSRAARTSAACELDRADRRSSASASSSRISSFRRSTHLPAAGELVATDDFLVAPGGCAANSAIALRRLGVPVAVCGRVGDDLFGEMVIRDLRGRGIDTGAVTVAEATGTSKTVIVPVRGEDRRYIHTFGANAAFTARDIPAGLLEDAEVIYVGGYLILPGLRRTSWCRASQRRGQAARIVLDVAVSLRSPGSARGAARAPFPGRLLRPERGRGVRAHR